MISISRHYVVELAANDGYLLQYVQASHIPCIGIEPAASAASCARKRIQIIQRFFREELAREMRAQSMSADLVVANNVLAHVPDIKDFVSRRGDAAEAAWRRDVRGSRTCLN